MHTYTPADSISDGPVTNLFSILYILVEVLSRAHVKSGKTLNDYKFGTSIGRFSSAGAASTAVKGLTPFVLSLEKATTAAVRNLKFLCLFFFLFFFRTGM